MVKMMNVVVAIIALAAMFHGFEADEYIVGNGLGWTIPPGGASFYVEWASEHVPLLVNFDYITFNFQEGEQDVALVNTKKEFHSCNTTNMYWNAVESTRITFELEDTYYFLSSFPGHCAAGQKIALRWSKPRLALATNVAQCPSPSPSASAEANTSVKLPPKVIANRV